MGTADIAAARAAAARRRSMTASHANTNDRPGGNSMGTPQRYVPMPSVPRTPMASRPPSQQVNRPANRVPGLGGSGYNTDWNTYENVWTQEAGFKLPHGGAPNAPAVPSGSSGGGSGGGGYGGGGGGGGVNPADYTKYVAAMKQLLQSKLYDTPAAQQNPLTAMVNPAVDADVANARGAFANIGNQVSQADPYLALIANRAPQLRPEMEQFLQGQGADTGQYGNAVNYANAQLGAGDQNWQNLARILGANHVAGQQGVVDTAKLQGEGIAQGLEGQRTQLNALAQMQQMQMDREAQQQAYQAQQEKAAAIMQLITQGLQYGQAPDLTGLV